MLAASLSVYIFVFFGLILSGDIFLVAMIYSSRFGFIDLPILFVIAICASTVSDTLWYAMGRFVKNERLKRLPLMRKKPELAERLSRKFESRASLLLFSCKFLYGTRIITQVLCGTHRMKYGKYFSISLAGTVLWTSFLMLLITTIHQSLALFKGTLTKIEIGAVLVAAVFVALRFMMRRFLQEKPMEKKENLS